MTEKLILVFLWDLTSSVYVPHVSQHGNTGYYTGEHLVYASDGPGNTNSGYHAGGAGRRHAGYYPGNAAAVPTPASYYAAVSSGGGIPFTTATIMPTGGQTEVWSVQIKMALVVL